jgi:DNA-binding transcriptional regulator YhcF (GntR family)
MSTSWEPLPSIYRSKQEFLASLPSWRRLLQKLNWHPTVELKVQRYAIEQRLLQMKSEDGLMKREDEQRKREDERMRKLDAKLAELDARLSAIGSNSSTCSNQPPATLDKPET